MTDAFKSEAALPPEGDVLPNDHGTKEEGRVVRTPKMALVVRSRVIIGGHEYDVERRLNDSWYFLNPKTNEPCCYSDSDIAKLQATGRFHVVFQPNEKSDATLPPSPLCVGEHAHASNMRKLEYVEACVRHPDFCLSRGVLIPIAEAIAQKRGERVPAFQSMLNWIEKYDRYFAVYGAAAFSDRHDKKGNYGDRTPEYQNRALQVGIDHWLKRQSKANAYASVVEYVREYNATDASNADKSTLDPKYLDETGDLLPPSKRTFERRCDRVDPAARDAMRIGFAYAKQRYRTHTTTALPDRPYAHVEVDHATLDIQLVHPGGTICGRPDLIAFRDRATAMIIGYGLGYEEPSYTSFIDGLRHTMYPKDMSSFPKVRNGFPCFGRIENLYHDNAFQFIGDNIREAARQLQINLVRLQPKEPWLKGALEKFFNDLNLSFVHQLEGTTLGNVVARPDHEHLGKPTYTREQFEHLLNIWICDIYNAGNRRALGHIRGFGGQSPLQAWAEKVRDYETDALPGRELFIALAGHTSHRTIQKNGITIDHIIYEGPELANLLGNPKHKQRDMQGAATQYKVVRDPNNLSEVYVHDHHTGAILTVSATVAHREYAKDLTLTEHEIVCARAREASRKKNKLSTAQLMRTKAMLNEIAAETIAGPKFKTTQRQLARWLEGDRRRQLRSEVESFAPEGNDYLEALPPRAPKNVTKHVSPEAGVGASAVNRMPKTDETAPPTNEFEDDLEEFRSQKKWNAKYD
ncbi:MAG: Mu transposase C-terminal domain-containing protein [Alphaproteobacteria bacterium]|nr:Mu transposase C-terminal domain-containing protein [Alphaproteobacteria bacterium]